MDGNTFILAETTIEKTTQKSELPQTTTSPILNNFLGINSEWTLLRKDLVWRNVVIFGYLHYGAFYGLYLLCFGYCKLTTILFATVYMSLAIIGVTAGAHRLWSHKSYKAIPNLRRFLVLCNSMCFQNCIYEWVRDHRVHHKFVDTNADPHNINRGFFFAHMGWLLLKKHPDVQAKGKTIDMSDLERDEFVMFQKRHYTKLMICFTFILPTAINYYFLGESLRCAWYFTTIFRYTFQLHGTWLVNSAAHIWGMKPYDRTLKASDNVFVGVLAYGEGWHNYHHVFPWDYKAAELGMYRLNFTTAFLDFMAYIGWAYDLRTVSNETIRRRAARTGDGNNSYSNCVEPKILAKRIEQIPITEENVWGWDDPDMLKEDRKAVQILNRSSDL